VTPFNFLETKIDVPALDRRAARRLNDTAPNESGCEFDRLVADAAKESKTRGDDTMDCSAPSSDDAVESQQLSDAAIDMADNTAIDAQAILQISDAAPVRSAPSADISLAATVAAPLLPDSDRAIWLPASIAVPIVESPAAVAAANINLKPAAPAATAESGLSVESIAPSASLQTASAQAMAIQLATVHEANADFAASVADLFELDLSSLGSPALKEAATLNQTVIAAMKPWQVTAAATSAANTPAPAAGLQVTSQASVPPAELTLTATAAIQPKEPPRPEPAADEALNIEADVTAASMANKPDATALPMPRDFVREVATQYQATADAGSSSRTAGDAAPAEQVSIRLIHALHEGRKAVQIHLHPSELGSIDVAMQWKGDRLTAHFVVERPETLDLLQRDIRILEQSLGDSGFKSDNGSLSFSLRQQAQGQAERQAGNASSSSDRTQNAAAETPADETSTMRDGVLVLRV